MTTRIVPHSRLTGPLTLHYKTDSSRPKDCEINACDLFSRHFKDAYKSENSGCDVIFVMKGSREAMEKKAENDSLVSTEGNSHAAHQGDITTNPSTSTNVTLSSSPSSRRVYAHSMILRQQSPILAKLLEQHTNWTFYFEDLFPGMHPLCFIQLVRYMYQGMLRFPREDLQLEMMSAARTLGMRECQNAILGYFASFFTPQDAIHIAPIALRHGHREVFEVCLKIVSFTPSEHIEGGTSLLLQWDLPIFRQFVKMCGDVKEESLCKVVLRYCEENAESRYNTTPEALFKANFEKLIRYPLMKPEEIHELFFISKAGWVDKKYLVEAWKFHSLSEKLRLQILSPRTEQRLLSGDIPKWIPATRECEKMITITRSTVEKVAANDGWNCMVYSEIRRSRISLKITVDHTNSDLSGLTFGIVGADERNEVGNYSLTQYNPPGHGGVGNPKTNSETTFVVDQIEDTIVLYGGTTRLGVYSKRPSSMQKPLLLAVYLYYQNNKVTISRGSNAHG